MLVTMQVSKRLDWENPDVLFYVRCLYVVSTLVVFAVYVYVRQVIVKKNDQTVLKYFEEPNRMAGETEKKLVTTTNKTYDLQQIDSAIKGIFTGIAMTAGLHLYMKYTNPVLSNSLSGLKGVFDNNMVKIHLLGKSASGELSRPFKAPSMFDALTGNAASSTNDKQSIEKAEISGKGGVKED